MQTPRAGASALALALCALALTGCLTPPSPPAPSPTPLSMEQLEPLIAECGGAVPSQRETFSAVTLSVAEASGMLVTLDVGVDAGGGSGNPHGEHELGGVSVRVVDETGRVVGITMADGWRELSGLEGLREVELGACPAGAGAVGGALADGDYRLIVSGSLRPLDHAHAQQEVWLAEPLAITVVSGAISAG